LYWGGDFPTEVTESVTALKGLTGFMYGFGEPGGAISYKLKRPTEQPETSLNLTYRNPALVSGHIDTSHNIGDDFAFRTNLATEQGTSYNESEIDRTVVSLALDKNFGDSVNWLTNVVYEKHKIEAEPLQFYFSDYDVASSGGKLPKISYDYDDFNVDNSYYDTETLTASTGLEWQINKNWELNYKLGISSKEHKSNKSFAYILNREGDYTGYSYNFAGKLDNFFNQFMLQGIIESDDIKHEMVAGVGLQKAEEKWGTDWYWENDFNGNLYKEQTFRITRTPDFSLESKPSYESRQAYAFASDTIHFNEQWQAIIGLRYTDYDLESADYTTTATTPTLAIIYKPNEQTSFYGSYVEGLEPGVLVAPTFSNAGTLLDATVSEQYEIGVKHTSGKFNYTAALFKIERVSQMETPGENPGDLPSLNQDGLEIYQGLDVSAAYQITDNLNLGLGALYLDGSLENVADITLEGKDAAYASDWQFVGNFEYKPASIQGLKLHGNARYFGESYTSTENILKVPSYTLVSAGASYDFSVLSRPWTLNANVNNLLNKKYWAGGGWSSGNMGEGRNISLGLNTKF
ncbi:MAG: TonB-dependent siderophore receptor, partial [Cellvibrio sp.]